VQRTRRAEERESLQSGRRRSHLKEAGLDLGGERNADAWHMGPEEAAVLDAALIHHNLPPRREIEHGELQEVAVRARYG
jgi:hypothetical protein